MAGAGLQPPGGVALVPQSTIFCDVSWEPRGKPAELVSRARRWLGIARLPRRQRRVWLVALSAWLFVGIFILRLETEDPESLVLILLVIPVGLLALELGVWAGIGSAILATGLVVAWDLTQEAQLTFLDYASRSIAFLLTGTVIGLLSAGARAATRTQLQLIESAPDAVLGINHRGRIMIANPQAERLFGYEHEELIGEPIEALVPEDMRDQHAGDGAGFFASPRTRRFNVPLDLRHKSGRAFPCEISLSSVETPEAPLAIAVVRDVSERRRAEEELRAAVRRLRAASEIALAVGGETDLQRVLSAITERGRSLVDARALTVMLADGDELVVAATAGQVEEHVRGVRVPQSGAPGHVLRTFEPMRLDRVEGDPRALPEAMAAEAAMLVPLEFRGSALGVVVAFDRRGGPQFGDEDELLLASFAASAATAVATAQYVAEDRLRRSIEVSEHERRRWARELHDETLQSLGALRVSLGSALRYDSDEALRRVVDDAVDEIAREIEALRGLITELRPAALDELGLAAALEALSDRSARTVGLDMDTQVSLSSTNGGRRLTPELESTIYRLVQEALTNVAKHARAEHVLLRVVERNGSVEVVVQDDGVGFDPRSVEEGFGLLGMRERVAMAGGEISVRSAPGHGTTMRALLPAPPVR
jgi:PAS domain S-box-containing protein